MRERYGSGANEERDIRARVLDLFFFFLILSPGGGCENFSLKEKNQSEREICRRLVSPRAVFTNAKRANIERGWKTERSSRAHFWFTAEVVVRKTVFERGFFLLRARDFFFLLFFFWFFVSLFLGSKV